jgi:2-polyprenyl-3-methyl-5-hydroxy-6-metoxy-1,4-benzoquinol methylase
MCSLAEIGGLESAGTAVTRARESLGLGDDAVYAAIARLIGRHRISGRTVVDIGCGAGRLWPIVANGFGHYVGVDIMRWDGFPAGAEFICADLDRGPLPMPDRCGDLIAAVEVIEHVESPRALMRELARVAEPKGWILVTTPNQLSLLSKFTLFIKNEFNAFQERPGLYPAHLTALLEVDLRRIAAENALDLVEICYSNTGRMPFVSRKWPRRLGGRNFSDNILMLARRRN